MGSERLGTIFYISGKICAKMRTRFLTSFLLTFALLFSFSKGYAQKPRAVDKLEALLYYLENYYVDTLSASRAADMAIVNTLKELDPHSYYLSVKELKEAEEPLQGNF